MATYGTSDRLQQDNTGSINHEKSSSEVFEAGVGVPEGALTSEYYRCKEMPERFNHPDWFKGYGRKECHPMYRTSNSAYGSNKPSVHTMQTSYHSMSQQFSADLGKAGMYRNHSLNCAMDKSNVDQS